MHQSVYCSLILKLVPGCLRIFSVGHIQTRHNDLLPPQVCGRLWRVWRLVVHTFLHPFIYLIDINILQVLRPILIFLLFACMYFIDWISINWLWNLYFGVLENFLCEVSKLDIRILFLRRFVESLGEGAGFMISLVFNNIFTGLN